MKPATRIFRFAPSPNGYLHLGHALSAILNFEAARASGGRFLLRIEDIDTGRARPELEAAIYEDLTWLGLKWETPVRRQSEHFSDYAAALDSLKARGLVYPCFCARRDIARRVLEIELAAGELWPRDPDGAPLYPGTCREVSRELAERRVAAGEAAAWRLDMARALHSLSWPGLSRPPPQGRRVVPESGARALRNEVAGTSPAKTFVEVGETGSEQLIATEPAAWGDVVLARKDAPTSYHLAVTVDDALQGVTDVIRGRDLFSSTSVHRLLQALLGLPTPRYRHHRLVLDASGEKLSKSLRSTALRELRAQGETPVDIRLRIGV